MPATDGAVNQAGAMRRARDLRDAADREARADRSPRRWSPRRSPSRPSPAPRASCTARSPRPTSPTAIQAQANIVDRPQEAARRADQDARHAHASRPSCTPTSSSRSRSRSSSQYVGQTSARTTHSSDTGCPQPRHGPGAGRVSASRRPQSLTELSTRATQVDPQRCRVRTHRLLPLAIHRLDQARWMTHD